MDTLDLDEFFAQLLVSEGFSSLEEVAFVEMDELLGHRRCGTKAPQKSFRPAARDYLEEQNKLALEKARELGVEESLIEFEGLTPQMLVALGQDGVKDPRGLRHLRRLGTGRRLDHRRRRAHQG